MRRVGFTGTQWKLTREQIRALQSLLLNELRDMVEFHHGDCVGADSDAHDIVRSMAALMNRSGKIVIVGHPPLIEAKRAFKKCDRLAEPMAYLDRNKVIVHETEALVACPRQSREIVRSGTWSTVRYARRQKRPIILVLPTGDIER